MIKLNKINKYYNKGKNNEIHVINDTSLSLPNTGLISLLGESGSGKTTLLNVIGGLDNAIGEISYDDVVFKKYSPKILDKFRSKNIGYIFQNYYLIPHLSVYDNLKLALNIIGLTDQEEIRKRIEYSLNAVGLFKYRKKRADALSGGQMQRVSIARALVKTSKIIIADEPTGNLDSNNSIEIMNILKKLSETSLVILVTHNKSLAHFYSDQIIELSDGKIINTRENNKTIYLENIDDNKIYLKDLQSISEGNLIKTTVYSENEIPNIEIKLIEKNGTYYIESNVKIKPLEESNFVILDENREDITLEDVKDSITYDNSWYNNNYKPNMLSGILSSFGNTFKTFFKTSKKEKFFRLILFFIGFVIAISSILLCQYLKEDDSGLPYSENMYTIGGINTYNKGHEASPYVKEAYEKGLIHSIDRLEQNYLRLTKQKNSYEVNEMMRTCYEISYNSLGDIKPQYGRAPQNYSEVAIGYDLALEIQQKLEIPNIESVITMANSFDYSIVGILPIKSNLIYTFDEPWIKELMYSNNARNKYSYYKYEYYTEKVIQGIEFKDISTIESNALYIARNYIDSSYTKEMLYNEYSISNDNKIVLDGISYEFCGFVYSTSAAHSYYITNNLNHSKIDTIDSFCVTAFPADESIDIISGKKPVNACEIALPEYYDFEIGEQITIHNNDYTVVGIYRVTEKTKDYFFDKCSTSNLGLISSQHFNYIDNYTNKDIINYYDTTTLIINEDKLSEASDFLKSKDLELISVYDNALKDLRKDNNESKRVIYILIIVLASISLIYIYISFRSKMIQDIYDIGVLRSLGSSKGSIIASYGIKIFVETLLTSALGYILAASIFGYVLEKIAALSNAEPYIFNNPIIYLFLILLFIVNIIVGLIPILLLLRKTPSQIIAKYDI